MPVLQVVNSDAVQRAIDDAAGNACAILDAQFPGGDSGGITTNFQGVLAEVIARMLSGQSILDAVRGHATALPRLVVGADFFGCPSAPGEMFLIQKADAPAGESPRSVMVLEPDARAFRPIEAAGDAFTSFSAAADAAMSYLLNQGLTIEQAKELNLQVVAVDFDRSSTADYGFKVLSTLTE